MKLKQILLFIILLTGGCLLSFRLIAQPTAGLVAYFKLNGNTLNQTATNITATAFGTSYTTNNSNIANSALQFAGTTNSYVEIVDNGNLDFSGTTNFTVQFGFFFNGTTNAGLFDNCLNYNGYGVYLWAPLAGTWNLQFNYRNASVGSPAATAFSLNRWHSVTAVRNNGTISLYIDGFFRLSTPEGTGTPNYVTNTVLGALAYLPYSPPRYNPLNGKMDEVRIYNRALTATEILDLSGFTLPLRLGDFTGLLKNNSVDLNWETLSEANSKNFEIERSSDGKNFYTIDTLQAKGSSNTRQTYQYTDRHPGKGVNYYRLNMVDYDGAATYSRIIAIQNENIASIRTFPNPAIDVLQIQIPSLKKDQASLIVTDASGKTMKQSAYTLQEGNNAISLSVTNLSAGTYYLLIRTSSGQQSKTFVKQ